MNHSLGSNLHDKSKGITHIAPQLATAAAAALLCHRQSGRTAYRH